MKQNLKFSALAIFTVVFSLLSVCPNVHAQTSAVDNSTDEKEKQEIEKFVLAFLKAMEETNDLNRIPEKFFASDFKKRMTKYDYLGTGEFFEELSEDVQRANNFLQLNLFFLIVRANIGDDVPENDEDDLSAGVKKIIEKYKKVNEAFSEGGRSPKFETIEEVREWMLEMRSFEKDIRKYVEEKPVEWRSKHRNFLIKNGEPYFYYYSDYICEPDGTRCEGLPEKTKIIRFRTFPLDFEIVKVSGEYKILSIDIAAN